MFGPFRELAQGADGLQSEGGNSRPPLFCLEASRRPVSDPSQAPAASPLSGPLVTALASSHCTCPRFGACGVAAGGGRLEPGASCGSHTVRAPPRVALTFQTGDIRAPNRHASLCPWQVTAFSYCGSLT